MKTKPNQKTILVIDNDLDSRILLSTLIKGKYNNFIHIESNEKAFKAVRKPVDLIFIELHCISCNYKLLSRIKALNPETPLIALTACAMNNEKELSLKNDCDAYISKPFRSKKLLDLSKSYL